MRIAIVSSSFPYGSIESFLRSEIEGLIAAGHEVVVIPLRPRGGPGHSVPDGVEVLHLGRPRPPSPRVINDIRRHAATRATSGRTLSQIVRQEAGFAGLGPSLARLVSANAIDHLHAYWADGPATTALYSQDHWRVPWSFSAHRGDISGNATLAKKSRDAEFVRFVSETWRQHGIALGVSADKAKVVHVGVVVPPVESLNAPESDAGWHIVCPAALDPRKGQSFLLEALAELKTLGRRFRLTLAGEGPDRPALERLRSELGLDDLVSMPGQVAHEELLQSYSTGQVNLVVLPSFSEGIAVSLMEAMARRVPVVATDVDGTAELVPPGFGLLVPPGDAHALARAIDRRMQESETLDEVSEACRSRVELDFEQNQQAAILAGLMAAAD